MQGHINYRFERWMFISLSCYMYLARFQAAPELVERLRHFKHRNSVLSKYTNRLQEKISRIVEVESVGIDEETDEFIRDLNAVPTLTLSQLPPFRKYFGHSRLRQQKRRKLAVCGGTL